MDTFIATMCVNYESQLHSESNYYVGFSQLHLNKTSIRL